jgi:hypothetical protein
MQVMANHTDTELDTAADVVASVIADATSSLARAGLREEA